MSVDIDLSPVGRAKITIQLAMIDGRWYNAGDHPLWICQTSSKTWVSAQPPFCRDCNLKKHAQ
jgi:hypothetical protein